MTYQEASILAHRRGLNAVEDERSGFCLLLASGGALVVRAGTWDECFAKLEPSPVTPAPRPDAQAGPLFEWKEN